MAEAVRRRVEQELGLRTAVSFVYKFEYKARFGVLGTEHELCWVYVGQTADQPVINTTEIDQWRWISGRDLDRELATAPASFTPWFKLEWQRLREEFAGRLAKLAATNGALSQHPKGKSE